jgi:hypothetical protein
LPGAGAGFRGFGELCVQQTKETACGVEERVGKSTEG